jgi:hypothetical protein
VTPDLPAWQRLLLRHGAWLGFTLALAAPAAAFLSGFRWLRGAWFPLMAMGIVGAGALAIWVGWRRERLIREAPLPQFLKRKLRQTYPHLQHTELVERGLRQFFLACHRSRRQFVAMPSRAADAMWHEFILHTQAYRDWCRLALGRFLHHTPAEALGPDARRNDGLRRAWFWACRDEAINPRSPTRLPLLFALDAKLAIPGGYRYVPDCRGIDQAGGATQCGSAFADGSASGDSDGLGGADSGGDGGGCGGGD